MRRIFAILFITFIAPVFGQQYSFQKIGLEQGMPSSRINAMIQDSRGFFWLATEGAGLVRYDGFEFKTFTPENTKVRPLLTALCEDSEGNIWAASDNTLLKYDGLTFSYFYLPNNDRIQKIGCGHNAHMVVASNTAVYSLGNADTLTQLDLNFEGKINDLLYLDELWLATDSGIYKGNERLSTEPVYDLDINDRSVFAAGDNGVIEFANNELRQINSVKSKGVSARDSKVLGLTDDEILIYSKDGFLELNASNGLDDERYKGCYLSNSGVVWLYSNQGLTKLENTSLRLYNEKQKVGPEIFSVWSDGQQVLAGSGRGITSINGEEVNNFQEINYNYGVVLAIDRFEGLTWLGTERGLVRFDGRSFTEAAFSEIEGGYIFALKATKDALWIGTGMGIFKYSKGRLENISASENLPFSAVYAISEGKDGSLWFATYTEGFMRFSESGWENVRELGGMKMDSLRFNTFTAVSANEIWAGTLSEGLYHLTGESMENISPADLNFAEIKALEIGENTVWMTTNKGLFKTIKTEGLYKVKEVTQVSRLIREGFSPQALTLHNDQLVAGSPEGLFVIDLNLLQQYVEPPQLAITDVELSFGEVQGLVDYAEGIFPFYGTPKELRLPPDLNFLSFTMAGLTGYQPENLIYRYRVKGLGDNWTQAGTRREAIFSNIKPGNYTFEAQVTREGEEWVENSVSYHFVILNPIYKRWWFILTVLVLVATLTYLYVSDRIKRANQQLRLENSLLDMERKALRLQMNPHFIFNALDSISSFIFKNDPKQAVRYLNNFARLMRLTLESSMEHVHPVETEVSVLKNYLELEKLRFQGKFEYEIEVDDEIDYDVAIPPMLIQPHVENAILHGIKPKEEKSFLSIRFILDEEFLICEVEDNGIGRKAAKAMPKRQDHRSMATQINRDRIRLLRLSKNEEVDIQIIDLENPTGTKVIIKLPAESI